ncbi:MAG: bifunctional tetrahydrofolate synthase/dihydrofolate synthase [Gammaproteobacteria bacterium]|nr:bifunctional tetrahydrofolate synthase/dihydrofolate synthase [Gammaproteobacteria bacterium]
MPSTLEEWLAYQSGVHPRPIDLGLDRLRTVLARLGFRRPPLPVVTVAGTNGKGSVVATSAAILAAAGLRVGVFSSPHLRDYRERIRVAGHLVEAEKLVAAFERIERSRGDTGLTFFEYNTLAALLIFEAAELDAWVLEIGMGGRLDAVNVIDADAAVVVSIGFDHQEYLGDTLEQIGREKAGVFRAGRAAVLGGRDLPPVVQQRARDVGARLKRLGEEFDFHRQGRRWRYEGPRWRFLDLPPSNLRGEMQYQNAATAIAALEELNTARPIDERAIAAGLVRVTLEGRFQVVEPSGPGQPSWILDVAHNPAAAAVLAGNLRATRGSGRTLAVCGVLADKDAASVCDALADCVDGWWFATTTGERGQSGAALAARAAGRLRTGFATADSIESGCEAALRAARAGDRILVFGSFHVVGPALDWLDAHGLLREGAANAYTPARGA